MKLENILDVTLRDGALGLDFPYTLRQSKNHVEYMSNAGLRHIEVGFVNHPASSLGRALSFGADVRREDVSIMTGSLAANVYRMLDADHLPGTAGRGPALSDLIDTSGTVRLTSRHRDLADVQSVLEELRNYGQRVAVNLKHCGSRTPEDIQMAAGRASQLGAKIFYIVDTTGSLTPNMVMAQVAAAKRAAPSMTLGFHGHDNLGLSVANTLAAFEAGATLLDASLAGVGAGGGNTPLEALVLLASDATLASWTSVYNALSSLPTLEAGGADRAFWGYLGVDSRAREEFARNARRIGCDVHKFAWQAVKGRTINISGHARIDRFSSEGKRSTVRKTELTKDARLREEVTFCQRTFASGAPVPEILDFHDGVDAFSYRMPFYDGPTLSELLREVDSNARAIKTFEQVSRGLRSIWATAPASISPSVFARDMYLNRPLERTNRVSRDWNTIAPHGMLGTWESSSSYDPEELITLISSAPRLKVDNFEISSVNTVQTVLERKLPELCPEEESMVCIHGDPHFGNVLLSGESQPVFLDPAGFLSGGDAAYDVGKMLLSLGLHDPLLHDDITPFDLLVRPDGVSIMNLGKFRHQGTGARWQTITNDLQRLALTNLSPPNLNNTRQFETRVHWVEAIHHISIAPTMIRRGWLASAVLLVGLKKIRVLANGENLV